MLLIRSTWVRLTTLLVALATITNVNQAEPLITDVFVDGTSNLSMFTGIDFDHPIEGAGFVVPLLDEDVPAYTDRDHEWNGVSFDASLEELGLAGAEYVMTANDDKAIAEFVMDIELSAAVDAYVFMDTRATQPQWLTDDGWVFLNRQIGMDEAGDSFDAGAGIDNTFWIWKKADVPAGTLTTYERGGAGNSQYGVAVTLPGVGPGPVEIDDEFPGSDFVPGNFGLIDIGATDGRPDFGVLVDESGVGQIGADVNGAEDVVMDERTMISSLGHEFRISLDNLDEDEFPVGTLDWRDRGDNIIASQLDVPLIQLGEDLVKNDQGIIRMTLSGLPAGPFDVTSFHLDPGFDQSEEIIVWVDTGDGFVESDGLGDASLNVALNDLVPLDLLDSSATFSFTADGENDVIILFDGRSAIDTEIPLNGISIQYGASLAGDYDQDGVLGAGDLDLQAEAISGGEHPESFDLNGDGLVDFADRVQWTEDLKNTWIGDSNLDGEFNSGDLVDVFTAGKYETGEAASWTEGDWDGDGLFGSTDFVAGFQTGGYEQGPRAAAQAVPEPTTALASLIAALTCTAIVRRWRA